MRDVQKPILHQADMRSLPADKASTSQLVLAALKGTNERHSKTAYALVYELGISRARISSALGQLITAGKVMRANKGNPAKYCLYRPPKVKKPEGEFAVAGKITIGRGAVWGAGLA